MCRVVEMNVNGKKIHVAELKEKYIENIVDAASKCDFIDRIMLFGSSTQTRCKEDSDIDLAIFGNQTEYKALRSKQYDAFANQIYNYDDSGQSYDLLYFATNQKYNGKILEDIENGEMIYARS